MLEGPKKEDWVLGQKANTESPPHRPWRDGGVFGPALGTGHALS